MRTYLITPAGEPLRVALVMWQAMVTRRTTLAELEDAIRDDLGASRFGPMCSSLLGGAVDDETPHEELARKAARVLAADLTDAGWTLERRHAP